MIKGIFLSGLLAAILISLKAQAADTNGWKLVWSDEFNGAKLDPVKWSQQRGGDGWGNDEHQCYTLNNTQMTNGFLHIIARKEPAPEGATNSVTSARLRTMNKAEWCFGRFEIRAKVPTATGMWPAFWLLPTDEKYGGWPHSGEVDIMEVIGKRPGTVHGTLHFADKKGDHILKGATIDLPNGERLSDDFHVFRLDWETNSFRWYLDDKQYYAMTNWETHIGPFPKPFDEKFHILLNLAVGGTLPGPTDASTTFPQEFIVDYVRVWQRTSANARR